jgi:predicted ATPase/class 3 adenylate cyclase
MTHAIPGFAVTEKVCDSFPHVVYRATRETDGETVVLKTLAADYPKKEDLASLQREYRITRNLDVDGVIRVHDLVAHGQGNLALVMEGFGISLRAYLDLFPNRILPADQFFPLALRMVDVCGRIHDRRIIHKNLEPSNILIRPVDGEIRLIDFGSSSELSREHQDSAALAKWIEGALPYISPEQTGRINRDIDYRSDFYTLGVTFYEMLTGRLPFQANDPLEWIHATISRQPEPPDRINPQVPKALSAVVMKLLAKNAEDRYQSSYGLETDLKECAALWRSGSSETTFPLARADVSRRFQIPQKLYGREHELARLEAHFENAAHGAVEFCLVSGYSGIGKTALVRELGRSVVRQNGYLIRGKFDQYRQNAAYAALGAAFRDLVRQLLGESRERLDQWQADIRDALGTNAQLIIDVIPELVHVIGQQPQVQDLSPAEAQVRFQMAFVQFVRVFARAEHPLVIFLDDLQWSDVPTLHLVTRLVTAHELSHLFIIGAYRDNEVDTTHPLSLTLREIEGKRFVENLSLQPLDQSATDMLARETLQCSAERAGPLSQVLYERSGGNPFFTIELLTNLKDREIIRFDAASGGWTWEMSAVRQVHYTDNVVDIIIARQNRLPPATQNVLQLAACIGATFDLRTLSIIREASPEQTNAELEDALKAHLVVPLNASYKYVGTEPAGPDAANDDLEVNPAYKFQHDRVQQAAYSLIDPAQRQALHRSIGRLMLGHATAEELDERLMDVVRHLNEGRSLVTDAAERHELVRLNLSAGIKAKQSSAYDAALRYLRIGHDLLGTDAWHQAYDLAWTLNNELQHCYYLTGDWTNADAWTELLLDHARTAVEKGIVLANRTRQYATTGRMQESIDAATMGLSMLGFPFNPNPTPGDVDEERRLVEVNRAGRPIASLIDMPEITDEKARIASQLIMEIFPAAFLSASGTLFPYLVLKSANVALVYGNSPESAFAHVAHGMLLCGLFDDTAMGYAYGKLGVEMIEQFDDISLKSRIIYVYAMFVHHWSNHWTSMTPWFRKGIEAGYQSGDLLYLAYSAQDCIIWDPQLDLETASREHRRMLAIVRECEYQDSLDSGTLFLQMQLNFQGLTDGKFSMTDDAFDEARCVEGMYHRRFMTGISNYHIYKAEIHLMYNDTAGALPHVLEQERRMASVIALPQAARFRVVAFLVRAALLPGMDPDEQSASLEIMQEHLGKIAGWARQCRENFEHLRLLMEAELAGFRGEVREALALYERSITSACQSGFIRDEAMANELAARFMMRLSHAKAAEGYLRDAHYLYYRWGARRKVDDMEATYAVLQPGRAANIPRSGNAGAFDKDVLHADQLDIRSVLKASQTISGELVLENLLRSTLEILLENAGAQRGFIVVHQEGRLMIQGRLDTNEDLSSSAIPEEQIDSDGTPLIPVTLINMAIRSREPVVLDNAAEPNPFASDPYIRKRQPRSVICVPLPAHGKVPTAVYLENNLTQGAFTTERIEIIKLLASQASISMENARAYEMQERLVKAQQRFVPSQFLSHLGHTDIAGVELGESVLMNMSVLFSDIRNFTPLVERLSPPAVIQFLNRMYSQMGVPITASGGFIDSYAGDGIMALFSVPARQAVDAAIGMSRALADFNRRSSAEGLPPVGIGIGINTGPLVLGTMGANERMQCSVLGDTVNLASRIEQLTRVYNAQCLIGEQTLAAMDNPDAYSVRLVDRVAVKGKDFAVRLYEVLDAETDERRKAKESTRDMLHHAFGLYQDRQFFEACLAFSEAMRMDPADPVLSLLAARAHRYMETPPPDDWSGYEKLEHK